MDLRYPVGQFSFAGTLSGEERVSLIDQIAETPEKMRAAVAGLSSEQLDTPYRPGGWTVRQVVHHVPESHLNSYIRFKLAVTEDQPTIKPYFEDRWDKNVALYAWHGRHHVAHITSLRERMAW